MQTTLAQYNETQSQDSFALQNSKLLKVRLDQVTVQAKLGSMVAYQGEVGFEHAGSGGMSKMLKKAVTGEGQALMKVTGTGEVFLADAAQDIHLIYLEDDQITCNGPNVLAFEAGIDWDIQRAGDFNADGRLDLAVTSQNSNAVSILLGNGDGTFRALQSFGAGSTPVSAAVADFKTIRLRRGEFG